MSVFSPSRPARRASVVAALALGTVVLAAPARAAVVGFGDFSGFAINQVDDASPPTVSVAAGSVQLTNRRLGESRSVFATAPQAVGPFTASFTYAALDVGSGSSQGVAFVIQNGPAGASATGPANTHLGYEGIAPSLAIGLLLPADGASVSRTGLFKNGVVAGGSVPTGAVNAYAGHPIDVTVSYAGGSFVEQSMTDTVTGGTFSTTYVLSPPLASLLAGPTAYVGFTASTDSVGLGSNQTVSNFRFASGVPEPSAVIAAAVPVLALLAGRRRRR